METIFIGQRSVRFEQFENFALFVVGEFHNMFPILPLRYLRRANNSYAERNLFPHPHIKDRRAVWDSLRARFETVFETADHARELFVSVRARVEAGVKLIEGVAHPSQRRPAVLSHRHFESLTQKRHGVKFFLFFFFFGLARPFRLRLFLSKCVLFQ